MTAKEKIQDLIMHNKTGDAVALAKASGITTLDDDFVQALLYGEQKVRGCDNPEHIHFSYDFDIKMSLAEIFRFVIPEELIQKQYAKLLDHPNGLWSGCIPEALELIKKTGIQPKKKLVLTRYEQELLNTFQSDSEIEYLNNLQKATGIPVKLREEAIQEVFRRVISCGEADRLVKKEKVLGRKWEAKNSTWDVAVTVQEGFKEIYKHSYYDIKKVKAFQKRTKIKPSQETINEMYAEVIINSLEHTKCCGELCGANRVIQLTRIFKPSVFPDVAFKKIEELFFYRHPGQNLFFNIDVFKACFPSLKLTKNSDLRLKIERKCSEMVANIDEPGYHSCDIIHYLYAVKKGLNFTPIISLETLANFRNTLEKKDQYELLSKFNNVFPTR